MHWRLHRFFTSCFAGFFLGPTVFAMACMLRGEAISFPPVAIALFFATLSFLIAATTGLLFWLLRRKSQQCSHGKPTR
jgi:membrane protein DedA with SNARE-associated domain